MPYGGSNFNGAGSLMCNLNERYLSGMSTSHAPSSNRMNNKDLLRLVLESDIGKNNVNLDTIRTKILNTF